jgi:hypothetical protein
MADQPGYAPLSQEEKRKIQDDKELKSNPKLRADFAATLNDADRQWLDLALKPPTTDKPTNLLGKLREGTDVAVDYTRKHPGEVGATAATLLASEGTSALPWLTRIALATTAGAAGAGTGLGLSDLFDPESPVKDATLGDMAAQAADQGAVAGVSEGTGSLLNYFLKGGSNQLMNSAIGSQAEIRRGFPTTDLADTLNRNRINPTMRGDSPVPFLMRGYEGSLGLRGGAAQRAQGLADQAGARGVRVARNEVLPAMRTSEKMALEDAQAGLFGGQQQIGETVDELFNGQLPAYSPTGQMLRFGTGAGGDVPAQNAPNVIRSLQRRGSAAQAATNAGNLPKGIEAAAAKDLASGVRQTMNEKVPLFQAANQETQDLIAAGKVANRVSRQPKTWIPSANANTAGIGLGVGANAVGGDPILSAAMGTATAALSLPQVSAPVAIAMYQAGRIPYSMLLQLVGPVEARRVGFAPISGIRRNNTP